MSSIIEEQRIVEREMPLPKCPSSKFRRRFEAAMMARILKPRPLTSKEVVASDRVSRDAWSHQIWSREALRRFDRSHEVEFAEVKK